MQRVYSLLRNNQPSGPFTIGELLQQQIKPTDMVWIEGESTSWTPVSELELTPHREPGDFSSRYQIQQNAEELRPRHFQPRNQPKVYVEKAGDPIPSHAYHDDDAIVFVDHRKEKKNMLTEVGMTLLLVGLFAGGIYGSRTFLAGKKDIARPAATQMVSNDQNAAKPALVEKPGPDTINTVRADSIRQAATAAMTAFKKPVRKATDSQTIANTRPADLVEPLTPLEKEEAKTEPPIVKEEILKKEKTEPAQENGENKEVQKADDSEKKKGFLKKLFGKKKKDDERSGKDNNEN